MSARSKNNESNFTIDYRPSFVFFCVKANWAKCHTFTLICFKVPRLVIGLGQFYKLLVSSEINRDVLKDLRNVGRCSKGLKKCRGQSRFLFRSEFSKQSSTSLTKKFDQKS